jgi:hypothetical protein
MNWGVALRSEARHSSSMYWPIVYHRADLSLYVESVAVHFVVWSWLGRSTSSRSAAASLEAIDFWLWLWRAVKWCEGDATRPVDGGGASVMSGQGPGCGLNQ